MLDITAEGGRQRFRAQQNAQRLLAGNEPIDDVDILIAAARTIPEDPSKYATEISADAAVRTRGTRQRVRTVGDAMRRR